MVADTMFFHASSVPDDALIRFRKLAVETVSPAAPVLGEWLRKWVETEQYWRKTDPEHRPTQHTIALPPVHQWSDAELGKALQASTHLSYIPLVEPLGDFVDRVVLTIATEAGERLVKHG
jgi:hypothetical protein